MSRTTEASPYPLSFDVPLRAMSGRAMHELAQRLKDEWKVTAMIITKQNAGTAVRIYYAHEREDMLRTWIALAVG